MIKILFLFFIGLMLFTYIIYTLILIIIRAAARRVTVRDESFAPNVTMVVAAYNEEKVITKKLENCRALEYFHGKLAILIGSDGSSDKTVALIRTASMPEVSVFDFKERRGKVNVLKDLVSCATGEIIVFSDANTIYKPDALRKLIRHFADKRVGCVCGRLQLKSPDGSVEGEYEGAYWRYESFIKRMEGELGVCLGANGGIYALRKALFPDIPSDTIVEDFVIPMKILERGYKVMYEKDALGYEESSKTISDERKRKIRIGAGAYQSLFLTSPMLNIFRGFPSFAYWSHKVMRWLVPFFMIIILCINMFLLDESLYKNIFLLQVIFYLFTLLGYLLSKVRMHNMLFHLPYYFVAMNLSLFLGFYRFISGQQKVTWQRVER